MKTMKTLEITAEKSVEQGLKQYFEGSRERSNSKEATQRRRRTVVNTIENDNEMAGHYEPLSPKLFEPGKSRP